MSQKRDIVIFKEEGSYSCFPTLEQLADGRLVVPFTQRQWPSHCSKGRMRVMISDDGGESWQESHDSSLPSLWPGATGKFRCLLAGGTWLDMGAGGHGGHFDAPEMRSASDKKDARVTLHAFLGYSFLEGGWRKGPSYDGDGDLRVSYMGETHPLPYVHPHCTVLAQMLLIEEKLGVPVAKQRLIFAGRELGIYTDLISQSVQKGSTLHLLRRKIVSTATAEGKVAAEAGAEPEPEPAGGNYALNTQFGVPCE